MKKLCVLFLTFWLISVHSFALPDSLLPFNRPSFKIGTWRGSSFVESAKEKLPLASLIYFKDSNDDLIEALRSNKIDAFMTDRIAAVDLIKAHPDLKIFETPIDKAYYAMAFNKKNKKLRDEFSNEIEKLKQKGTLKTLQEHWFSDDENLKKSTVSPKGSRGILKVGTSAVDPPFSFYKKNKLVGIEIELMNQIAKNLDYSVEWSLVSHSNFVQALQTNQIDIDAGLLTITPERKKQVLFATPDYEDTVVLVLKK